jgi:putative hydrolase of the HAD superfamily
MNAGKKIKLIIFDIGRVLIGFDFKDLIKEIENNSEFGFKDIENELFKGELLKEFHKGNLNIDQFYSKLSRRLGFSGNIGIERFKELFLAIFFENEDIIKVLNNLQAKADKMIVSDISRFHWDNFASKHSIIRNYFPEDRQKVLSFREGVIKPNPEIYKTALEKYGVDAKEAVFIDDKPENVSGFQTIGGEGIWYDCTKHSTKKIFKEFSAKGVLI